MSSYVRLIQVTIKSGLARVVQFRTCYDTLGHLCQERPGYVTLGQDMPGLSRLIHICSR
jgi:hypothetical protein